MATITVSYTIPGLIRLKYNQQIKFISRGKRQADTLKLVIKVHVDQVEKSQAAENFYVPIFLSVAADTILGYFGGKGQEVSVFHHQLRPGLEGSREFLGVTREQFREQLGDFRIKVRNALAGFD